MPDGTVVASCDNKNIRVWTSKPARLLQRLSLESGRFTSIAVSPVSGHLASGSTDGMVRIWSPLKHDHAIQSMKHGPPVAFVRYSPDGKRILSAGELGACARLGRR